MELLAKPNEKLKEHSEKVYRILCNLINYYPLPSQIKKSKEVSRNKRKLLKALKLTALLHDIGKTDKSFQEYVRGRQNNSSPHALLGVSVLKEALSCKKFPNWICNLMILVMASHHSPYYGRLYNGYENIKWSKDTDFSSLKNLLFLWKLPFNQELILKSKPYHIFNDARNYISSNAEFLWRELLVYSQGLLIRADYYASSSTKPQKEVKFPQNIISKGKKLYWHQKASQKINKDIFIQIPTGRGKTETALLWAKKFKKPNLFYILPTNASINAMYKRAAEKFGSENVGFYHSRYESLLLEEEKVNQGIIFKYFLKPINITTPDQLLLVLMNFKKFPPREVIFSNSIFVFDEIHIYDDKSLKELGVQALLNALDDANRDTIDALYVGNMVSGTLSEQEHLGALIADSAGFPGIEAVKVEAACASGAAAFRQAVLAVASGAKRCAVALGVEKLTEFSGQKAADALAQAADADFETSLGLTFVALNALVMRRFLYEHPVKREAFAYFPMLAHANAQHNPNAMFRHVISLDQYQQAKMIADPINLLDSSPIADGAAAAVIVPADEVELADKRAVDVLACEVATDTIALHDRKNILRLKAVEKSAQKAFEVASLTRKAIDFFELHDAFSIMSVLSLEASGFLPAEEALNRVQEGYFDINGTLPIATMGGLKGRGHPVGATGLYQIAEAVTQLRGSAPEKIQVARPRYGMAQNIGGTGATVVTTILKGRI